MQADQMVHRLPEEAGAGHRAHAHVPGQHLAELQVGVKAVAGDVQQNVIGPLGVGVGDVQIVQALQQQIPLVGVQGQQLVIIALVEEKPGDHRLLQGAAAPTVRKSWTFLAVSTISAGAMM